jgi:hypothetical protein
VIRSTFLLLLIASCISGPCYAESDTEQIRQLIAQLRIEYDSKIQQLEDRLIQAEKKAENASQNSEDTLLKVDDLATMPANPASNSATAFNPAIGVVLSGSYASLDVADAQIPGFITDPEAGPPAEGFAIGETELNFNASIDDKFFGNMTFAIAVEDGEVETELEEAYIQSLAIPHGFTVTAGRFFSGVGYLNSFHTHTDDFSDRPLPYKVFLANQFKDDGAQLRWLAPTTQFLEIGVEILRGDSFPAAGSANNGKGAYAAFVHMGGDIGDSHSWKSGFSILNADVEDRSLEEDSLVSFTGSSDLKILDFVWKWAPLGNPSKTNLKIMGEYFWREEDGHIGTRSYKGDQEGWYLQSSYQFAREWTLGYRYDELDSDNAGVEDTILDANGLSPSRNTLMLQWANSEFGRFRLQYIKDESNLRDDDQFVIQYMHAFGAHGGHQF